MLVLYCEHVPHLTVSHTYSVLFTASETAEDGSVFASPCRPKQGFFFYETFPFLKADFSLQGLLASCGERGGSKKKIMASSHREVNEESSHSPLRSAAPPLMILATTTAPVTSSLRMVAPWKPKAQIRSHSITLKSQCAVDIAVLP